MQMDIASIEKQFISHKNRLLKGLEDIEKRKRRQFEGVMRELDRYRKRESALRRYETETANHLRQINRRIEAMKKLDSYDRHRIKELHAEMEHLRREMPRLEKDIKTLNPKREVIARHERAFSAKLSGVSSRVHGLENHRARIQRELDVLLRKEKMLRDGRIYWPRTEQQPPSLFRSGQRGEREKRQERERALKEQRAREQRLKAMRLAQQMAQQRSRQRVRAEQKTGAKKPGLLERILISKR